MKLMFYAWTYQAILFWQYLSEYAILILETYWSLQTNKQKSF